MSATCEVSQSGRIGQSSKEKWLKVNRRSCCRKKGEGNVQNRSWQRLLIDLATLITGPLLEICNKESWLQENVVQKTTGISCQKLQRTSLGSTSKSIFWSGVDRQAGIGGIDQALWPKRCDKRVPVGQAHLYQIVLKVLLL